MKFPIFSGLTATTIYLCIAFWRANNCGLNVIFNFLCNLQYILSYFCSMSAPFFWRVLMRKGLKNADYISINSSAVFHIKCSLFIMSAWRKSRIISMNIILDKCQMLITIDWTTISGLVFTCTVTTQQLIKWIFC